MTATNYFVKHPLWLGIASALVSVLMLLIVSFEGVHPARAADDPKVDDSKIIGGTSVPVGKYPFMTFLQIKTTQGIAYCGGSLIDSNSVLTAAHCLKNARSANVYVGRTVLSQNQGQVRSAIRAYIHPYYHHSKRYEVYDAAVLTLSRPVSGITPITLASSSQNYLEKPGVMATVAGWGNTIAQPANGSSAGNSFPSQMRETQVPVVSDNNATSSYGSSSYVPRLMVSAGTTGKDTCQGDSGGPMFAKVSGRYTQIGITSFGWGCGAAGYPGVYAEVNAAPMSKFIISAAAK